MTTPDGSMTSAESSDAIFRNSEESLLAALLEELTEAMRQGQQPDVEGVANRHPAMAADLRSLWATIWVAEEMAQNGPHELEPGATPVGAVVTTLWPPATESGAARVTLTQHMGPDSSSLDRFGEYEVFEELGRGGMGVVSRAREIARGRIVALKRLLHGPESAPQDLERQRRG